MGPVRKICAGSQAITMPGRIVPTTGGRGTTKDRRAATATATTNRGIGLGHPLGVGIGIVVGTAIEIETETRKAGAGSKIAIRTAPGGRTGVIAKCPAMKAKEAMQIRWAHLL